VDEALEEEHRAVQAEALELQNTVGHLINGLQIISEAVSHASN
jgi:hypothetical protein